MKVILLKNLKGLGHAGDVKDVADGYALNMLIPQRIAAAATPATLKQAEMLKKQEVERKVIDHKLVEERLAALAEERIVFVKKANEKSHLYDALDAAEIAEKLALPEDAIRLEKPIKELGTFDVPVAFGEQFGKVTIVIEAE